MALFLVGVTLFAVRGDTPMSFPDLISKYLIIFSVIGLISETTLNLTNNNRYKTFWIGIFVSERI